MDLVVGEGGDLGGFRGWVWVWVLGLVVVVVASGCINISMVGVGMEGMGVEREEGRGDVERIGKT